MWVMYKGHDDVLLTDYNGRRYTFPKNKPVEVPPEVYNNMVRSRCVETFDLTVCEAPIVAEPPKVEAPKPEKKKARFKERKK